MVETHLCFNQAITMSINVFGYNNWEEKNRKKYLRKKILRLPLEVYNCHGKKLKKSVVTWKNSFQWAHISFLYRGWLNKDWLCRKNFNYVINFWKTNYLDFAITKELHCNGKILNDISSKNTGWIEKIKTQTTFV